MLNRAIFQHKTGALSKEGLKALLHLDYVVAAAKSLEEHPELAMLKSASKSALAIAELTKLFLTVRQSTSSICISADTYTADR